MLCSVFSFSTIGIIFLFLFDILKNKLNVRNFRTVLGRTLQHTVIFAQFTTVRTIVMREYSLLRNGIRDLLNVRNFREKTRNLLGSGLVGRVLLWPLNRSGAEVDHRAPPQPPKYTGTRRFGALGSTACTVRRTQCHGTPIGGRLQ